MYESFYRLKEKPFSMLPDPGFLFLSKKHQMALTLLEYGLLNQVGFCVVSGETGSGKTTLLRKLLESIADDVTVGMITNTHKGFGELLDWVLSAFGIHEQGMSQVDMHQRFMDFLVEQYAANKSTLLIVDEAQNMTAEKLEELRMLSNVNSEKDQVLQVILAGQPDLKETLRLPELRQFAQRIGVDHHLGSLSEEETYGYIQHRLKVAGASREIFTEEACDRIHEYSGGTPRLINLLCDTVMVYGFADQQEVIDEDLVDEMVQERMKDSIVPLASTAPPKRNKPKSKKKKPSYEKVEEVEEKPVEKVQAESEVVAATERVPAREEAKVEDIEATRPAEEKATVFDESELIEQIVSESAAADSGVEETIEEEKREEEEDGYGDVRRRGPNTIQVLEPEEPPKTSNWKWAIVVAGLAVVGVIIFMIGTASRDGDTREKVVSTTPQTAPVVQEVPDKIKRQLEEAEKFRKELARRQEEDRARMEALEEQAAILQRERDEALAKAKAEEEKRAKEAALAKSAAKSAAKSEKEAKKAAERAMAEALAAERKSQLLIKLRAEEAARLETELIKQREANALREQMAAKQKAEAEAVVEVKKEEESFKTDPCSSSTARFLSTCR
jgi:type II secretory pathway predicted ATPase ExeA